MLDERGACGCVEPAQRENGEREGSWERLHVAGSRISAPPVPQDAQVPFTCSDGIGRWSAIAPSRNATKLPRVREDQRSNPDVLRSRMGSVRAGYRTTQRPD